jgi:Na+/H+-dicarboxylate symporter
MLDLIWLVPALPLAGFLLIVLFGRKLGEPGAGILATVMTASSFVVVAGIYFDLLSRTAEERHHVVTLFSWLPVGSLHVDLALLADPLSITMALFIFLILGGIMKFYGLNIFKFLRYIKEELLIVLGTSSSESALPTLMNKLENAGCSKSVVGLVVPTGYSFNLDGTSIYLSMAAIFLAQLYNVPLSFTEIMILIGILMLTSKGAAGVAGSGFVVLASTLSSMHTIPLEGLGFLWGVDKFMSEARAITNIIGNGVATIVIAKSENEFDEETYLKKIN